MDWVTYFGTTIFGGYELQKSPFELSRTFNDSLFFDKIPYLLYSSLILNLVYFFNPFFYFA